jgi:hypothetical protein
MPEFAKSYRFVDKPGEYPTIDGQERHRTLGNALDAAKD